MTKTASTRWQRTSIGWKATLALLFFCIIQVSVMAQSSKETKISLKCEDVPISKVFMTIEDLSGYKISFTYNEVQSYKVTINLKNATINEAMKEITKNTNLGYSIKGKFITVAQKKQSTSSNGGTLEPRNISGSVVDAEGEPIPGANIYVEEDMHYATTSDVNGNFSIWIPENTKKVVFSFVGMKKTYLPITANTVYKVTMAYDTEQIEEVVVNGMFTRKASSYTGSAITVKQEDLKSISNQNVLKALSALDPSFQIADDINMGSNPNALPNIQMRGETSFNIEGDYAGNANQPLFILDGFETTLEKVFDLDMNRISSITLLKDAAAKAIYGSKAGNGVVVIETIRPKTGKMRISYNGDLNIQSPDLSSYNLMNAQEKFDWEIAHHKYDDWQSMNNPMEGDKLYKSVYDAIASGVDTYWLSKPLQIGVGQKHTLSLEGGDDKMRYILGASYNNIEGVMKESDRNTFNINSTLSYTYKNIVFRNQMDYTRNTSSESPYGSFSEYTSIEPYYAPYDSNGNLKKILGYECASNQYPIYNPLYNASLNTKDKSSYTQFNENFEMDWHINDNFRFTAQLSYMRMENGNDAFYPSSHTMFVDYDANGLGDRKGRYTKSNGYSDNLSIQSGLSYNKSFGKHYLFFNGTWNMQTSNNGSTSVVAEGFGNDSMDDISMANSYMHDSRPSGSDSKTREVGIIGAFSYSYDNRYLFDSSYRFTGSSVYGSDNHWGGFWSLGAGWNIHNEKFFSKESPITLLKLRYSLGYTGTQNFNPYQARAKYQYGNIYYDGRLGTTIMAIPNTSLKWQKVWDNNFGIDFALKNFLTARFEYYVQNTDNMLTDITLPASTGFTSYKENMGEIQNKGYEISLGFTPWRNNEERSWVTFTASAFHNKNQIKKIYDIFKKSNDAADEKLNADKPNSYSGTDDKNIIAWRTQTTRPATKYYEGCSMTAIWGVRSLGIDPMTGKELFLDKNGDITYTWSSDNQVVIGDVNPKIRGTFGLNAGWKGFSFSALASYKWGGELYNTTLIDRVENVTGFGNLDKRVSETWTHIGDNAPYKFIDMRQNPEDSGSTTKPTSRFVQKDNEIYLSTINLGYDFYRMNFLKQLGLERLKVSFYANDLVRFSKVRVERGVSYPYARSFSFSLNATF